MEETGTMENGRAEQDPRALTEILERPEPLALNVNDFLALELGRKELRNLTLTAQLAAARSRIAELEAEKAEREESVAAEREV